MTSPVQYAARGPVAVLTMDNPPVNGLGLALRVGIIEGIDRALADPAVTAIVLTGSDFAFSGGADVREFGSPKSGMAPSLLAVVAAVEESTKPVVAAISGNCLGGGLELAMACHYRVAQAKAALGLPEVKLGLIPGASGTQRLPRLVGVETALNMIVGGAPVPAAKLAGTALLDAVVETGVLDAAVALAGEVAGKPIPKVRERKVDSANAEAFIAFARNTVAATSKNFPAPLKCVDAVAGAVKLPWAQGLAAEREIFLALMQSPESRALRHIFAAERAATKLPDVPADTPLRAVAKVGVIGAGTMGGGIAMNFINVGIPVVLLETAQPALDRGLATIARNYESALKKGRMTPEQLTQRLALITPTLDYAALADVDLVI